MHRVIPQCALLTITVAAGGCESDSARTVDGAVRDSAGIRIVENIESTWEAPWRVVDEPAVTIGSAEGDPTQLLYRVTDVLRLDDGSVVIANAGTNELLFFDSSGTFSHRAGGQGEGPGEFSMLVRISRFGPDSLVAMDLQARRLSWFDRAGQFGRSLRLEPSAELSVPLPVGIFHDGSLLVRQGAMVLSAEGPTRVERPDEVLYRYEPDGQSAMALGIFPGTELSISPTGMTLPDGGDRFGRSPRVFGRTTAIAGSTQRYYVADNAAYEIRAYAMDGQLSLLIRKQHTPVPVTNEDVERLRDARLERVSDPERKRVIRRAYSRKPPAPATMPAFGDEILLDTEGNLWVPEYSSPGEYSRAWSVFSKSGRFFGVVDMPEEFALHDIGSDYVLGLRTDQDGVQYVEVYGLTKQ